MVALGCILVGLGLGLTIGNMQETIALSLVGIIVGIFLYTRMGVYLQLKLNKKVKSVIYTIVGVSIGVLVGVITGEMKGSIMIGLGVSFIAIDIMKYTRNLRCAKESDEIE